MKQTVLDFNPTEREWEGNIGEFTKEEVLAMSEQSQFIMIGTLLWSRGEKEEATKYIEMIEDEQLKLDVYRTITHF